MRTARGTLWCLLLSLVGLGLSGYLEFLHLGLLRGELLGGPVCGSSGALNCHAVTAGSWGAFLGMPLALWGVLGYLIVLNLSVLGRHAPEWAEPAMTLIAWLAIAFVVIDLALLAIMAFVIRFYCLICLLTYAVNGGLLIVGARSMGGPSRSVLGRLVGALGSLIPSGRRQAAALFWTAALISAGGVVGLHVATTFVSRGALGNAQRQIREFVAKQPRTKPDTASDPMIGQADAPVQIVEFSDFLCPACQRASKLNTVLLANHRHDAAFVFKHYPLDSSCNEKVTRMVHPGACQLAAASECAHQQGKFWPFHDRVFERGHNYPVGDLDRDAAQLGLEMQRFRSCMDSGQGLEAVKRDIAEGVKIGVTSTPTYVINGVSMAGGINPAIFEDVMAVMREAGR